MKSILTENQIRNIFKGRYSEEQISAISYLYFRGILKFLNQDSFKYNYHGHRNSRPEDFDIDPYYTGGANANQRQVLYSGTLDVAKTYSTDHSDIDRIVSEDETAFVINAPKLMELIQKSDEKDKLLKAFSTLSKTNELEDMQIPYHKRQMATLVLDYITAYIKNDYRHTQPKLENSIKETISRLNKTHNISNNNGFDTATKKLIFPVEMEFLFQGFMDSHNYTGMTTIGHSTMREFFFELVESYNTQTIIDNIPEMYLSMINTYLGNIFEGNSGVSFKKTKSINVSDSYIASWLDRLNLVGCIKQFDTTIDDGYKCDLFDLRKLHVDKKKGDTMQAMINQYGSISTLAGTMSDPKSECVLDGTPREIMDSIMTEDRFASFRKYFSASAGVAEGFTIREHTESVMDFFKQNFQDVISMSPEINRMMNYAILVHDITKGVNGKNANSFIKHTVAKQICKTSQRDLPQEYIDIVSFIALESQQYTTDYYVNNNEEALEMLSKACRKILKHSKGSEPTDAEISGLASLCRIMQTCDSGAYTVYAKTRVVDKSNPDNHKYYTNINRAWSQSFIRGLHGYRFRKDIVDKEEKLL